MSYLLFLCLKNIVTYLKGNIIDYQLIQKLNLTIEILFINSLIIYFKRFYNGK